MNMIICGENCRHQTDGLCTLTDLTRTAALRDAADSASRCHRFEPRS